MSKLMDALRTVKVFNDFDFFQDQPYISLQTPAPREMIYHAWVVSKRGIKLSNFWRDHGHLKFDYNGREDKAKKFQQASEFMRDRFGCKLPLKRAPTGAYGDAEYIDNRIAELKAKIKSLESK